MDHQRDPKQFRLLDRITLNLQTSNICAEFDGRKFGNYKTASNFLTLLIVLTFPSSFAVQ